MKKIGMLLLIIMFSKIICFSQNILINASQDTIVSITSDQLKKANLIFIEHSKLKLDNYLLDKQINNYKYKLELLNESDSLKTIQINTFKELDTKRVNSIQDLQKSINNKNKIIKGLQIGGLVVSIGFIILLL